MNETIQNIKRKYLTPKNFLIVGVIAGVILIAGGIFAFWYISIYQGYNPKQIVYRDPKFTDQEKQVFLDRIKEADEKLSNASTIDERYKLLVDRGVQYYSLGMLVEARDSYQRAAELLPKNPTAWAELYHTELLMENFIRANRAIDKALEINDGNPQYWIWKIENAKDHLSATDKEIEDMYKEGVKASHAPELYVRYSRYLEEHGDLAGAVTQLKFAIEINPSAKEAYEEEISRIQNRLK